MASPLSALVYKRPCVPLKRSPWAPDLAPRTYSRPRLQFLGPGQRRPSWGYLSMEYSCTGDAVTCVRGAILDQADWELLKASEGVLEALAVRRRRRIVCEWGVLAFLTFLSQTCWVSCFVYRGLNGYNPCAPTRAPVCLSRGILPKYRCRQIFGEPSGLRAGGHIVLARSLLIPARGHIVFARFTASDTCLTGGVWRLAVSTGCVCCVVVERNNENEMKNVVGF